VGPQLLIDKSSLQSLTDREAFFLGRHYYLVVPPVLMAEIQADLEKARKSRKQKRARLRDSAADIARRLHCPEQRAFSLPRLILALESLRGRQVEMRGARTLGAFVTTTELGEEV